MFDPDPSRLASPGREGFPAWDFDVVSAELPCGVAWLASALLELRVALWRPWGIDDRDHWRRERDGGWRYTFPGSAWRRLVPGLVDGRRFRLRARPVPRFTHAWPGQLAPAPRAVLFVRDPRDALYSGWRRARVLGQTPLAFPQWLREPFPRAPLDRAGWAALFWRAALAARSARPTLVVRFEDTRRDPDRVLRHVLGFVGLRTAARARARALRAARHEVAAAADAELAARGVGPRLLAGGRAEEWRSHFTPEMHAAIGRGFAPVCAAFGYAPPSGDAWSPPDAAAVVAAIDARGPAQGALREWVEAALAEDAP
jgi:hypothetical protein